MGKTITRKEKEILTYINDYHDLHQYMPSIREIAAGVQLKSTATVHHHMNSMFIKGILATEAPLGASRAFRITEPYLEKIKNSKEEQDHVKIL